MNKSNFATCAINQGNNPYGTCIAVLMICYFLLLLLPNSLITLVHLVLVLLFQMLLTRQNIPGIELLLLKLLNINHSGRCYFVCSFKNKWCHFLCIDELKKLKVLKVST